MKPGGITPFPDMPPVGELPESADGGVALAVPFRVAADELAAWLDGIERVDELPPDSAGVELVRYGNGYFGMPFCPSPDAGVTCFPVGPGPDDDPFGYTCVCLEPGEADARVGGLTDDDVSGLLSPLRPRCRLHRVTPTLVECRSSGPLGCFGRCQVVRINEPVNPVAVASGGSALAAVRRIILACICV
jgi:hypothetical protein